ncbi:thioesterase family protein [Chitinophaga lutea]
MRQLFKPGDQKTFTRVVREEDCAAFDSGRVHPVYATFALGRDAEWCCRLFVLEMKDAHEEGIGTMLSVEHHSPATLGSEVRFTATVTGLEGHRIRCSFEARVGGRLIARGEQEQKILPKEKLDRLFSQL